MEEYIEKLLSQIRCKKAHPYIEKEIRGHIEDQIADNISEGMSKEEATLNAVNDMGDPVEVGISMDKIHRPQIAWKMLIIVAIISAIAIAVQWKFVLNINNNIANFGSITHSTDVVGTFTSNGGVIENTMDYNYSIGEFVRNIIVGFIVMSLLYFLDYTFVAKYSRIIGGIIIAGGLWTVSFGVVVNGSHYYLMNVPVSMPAFMMIYIPIYGAILYKYRGGGTGALLKCILWLIAPVFITTRIPSISVAGIMMLCMLAQLTVAIYKSWFRINKKIGIAGIWVTFFLLPIFSLFGMWSLHLFAEYQMDRIRSWLSLNSDTVGMISVVRKYVSDVPIFGNNANDIMGQLPDLNRDYIFTYILNMYGSLAGIFIIALIAVLIIFIFGAVIKQKNELGLSMGLGCGMLLLMNSVINILCAIGVLPPTASFLPFFSAGGSHLILCYALIGIVLSIYRYKDIYPRNIMIQNKNRTSVG